MNLQIEQKSCQSLDDRERVNHWVYVIRESLTGCIKVGRTEKSESIPERVKSLQTGCPYDLQIVAILSPEDHPGERILHSRLGKWRVRPTGEWFYGVDEAFDVLGIPVPVSVGTHQDVLNASFERRDNDVRAAQDLAELLLAKARRTNEHMLKRETTLREQERNVLHRMRREISGELTRLRNDNEECGKWTPSFVPGGHLLDHELIQMIVKEAMNTRWHGVEFRRWLLNKASWGTVRSVGCYPLMEEIRRQFEWYAENDPDFIDEMSRVISDAKRKARKRVAAT